MAGTRYGTELYGTVYYGGDVLDEFAESRFRADPTTYGRVFVTWTRPGGAWNRQRLVRNLVGSPVDENDGDVLLDEPVATASRQLEDGNEDGSGEEGLQAGRFYYYGLFVRDQSDNTWRRVGVAEALVTRDYGFTRRLYERLPEVYRVADYASLSQVQENEEQSFLYRWMSLFGLQLDYVRTELEGLRDVTNPRTVSSSLLPALARMVGVEYEPELGDRAIRRLTTNAVRLSTIKGTLAGAREYSTVFTGWDASVRIGHNIALDRLDAGPDGGVGRWRGKTNATTGYVAFTDATRGPAGQGALLVRATAAGAVTEVYPNPAGLAKPLERLQYAVPVIQGLRYVVSQYARTTVAGLSARMGMTWLDVDGEPLMGTGYGPAEPLDDTWSNRPSSTELAPAGARYLETSLRIDGTVAAGDVVRACGLQVQEDSTVKPWAPAREALVYLHADLVNYVGNTSGYGLSAEGWDGASSLQDSAGRSYLTFDPSVTALDPTLVITDSLLVDYTGDPAPVETVTADVTERISVYTTGTRVVAPRDVWSVLVDASALFPGELRDLQIGFALYDGDVFIRYEWSDVAWVPEAFTRVGHELTVPDNADFDRVAFAIRSPDVKMGWRNAALENVKLADAKQFDGSTPSTTLDYIWEGVPHRSPSHFYSRRVVRTLRLRQLLAEYLPHPASFKLIFASPVVPESPRAAHGSDLDPDDTQYTTVGVRGRFGWRTANPVGISADSGWAVESRTISVDLTSEWNLEHLHILATTAWEEYQLAGVSTSLVYDYSVVGAQTTALWNLDEQVAPTDALVVE